MVAALFSSCVSVADAASIDVVVSQHSAQTAHVDAHITPDHLTLRAGESTTARLLVTNSDDARTLTISVSIEPQPATGIAVAAPATIRAAHGMSTVSLRFDVSQSVPPGVYRVTVTLGD